MVREAKVDILGTEYTVVVGSELPKNGYDGLCYTYDKVIHIAEDSEEVLTLEGKRRVLEEIICHEISHAFLFESGYAANSDEESLVVWLSRYVRKIDNCVIEVLDKLEEFDKL